MDFFLDPLLFELQAIHDAIETLGNMPNINIAHIYKESLGAVKEKKSQACVTCPAQSQRKLEEHLGRTFIFGTTH